MAQIKSAIVEKLFLMLLAGCGTFSMWYLNTINTTLNGIGDKIGTISEKMTVISVGLDNTIEKLDTHIRDTSK